MGTRTPFARKDVSLAAPLEDGELYLLDTNSDRALKLLPLVRLKPTPAGEEAACYFFNREDRGGDRFLSYHYSQPSDFVEPGSVLSTLFTG
jgi:hypothetical protein